MVEKWSMCLESPVNGFEVVCYRQAADNNERREFCFTCTVRELAIEVNVAVKERDAARRQAREWEADRDNWIKRYEAMKAERKRNETRSGLVL